MATVLLLHMNGADESTSFIDSSNSAHTVVTHGSAQMDSSNKKLGDASGWFKGDAGSPYLSIGDSEDWNFAGGNFTIDLWVYCTDDNAWQGLVSQRGTGIFAWQIMLNGKKVRFEYSKDGTALLGSDFNTVLNKNQWYHVAVVRDGATVSCYINGIKEVTTINIGTGIIYDSSADVWIGCLAGTHHWYFGNLDEIHIDKGTAVWTENFTPPTKEYGESGESVFLITGQNWQSVGEMKIAVEGDLKSVHEGWVVVDGNWKPFWPPT